MKYYKISGKVVVDFEGELEFDDDEMNIEKLVMERLKDTSMSLWWRYLSIETDEQQPELTECVLVKDTTVGCDHHYVTDSPYDMQGYCDKCGKHEE